MKLLNHTAVKKIGAALTTGLLFLGLAGCASSTPTASGGRGDTQTCVGTWTVDAEPGPGIPPGLKLITLFADHNVILSEPGALISQNGAGLEFVGPGQGTYTDDGLSCTFSTRVLVADDKGAYSGYADVSGTVNVDSQGQQISGPFAIERILEDGEVVGTARTTFTGQRVGPH